MSTIRFSGARPTTLPAVRDAAVSWARPVLLAGPVALAFFSGGYFDGPRVWAGLIAWTLVAVAVATARQPFPTSRPGRLAIAGLGAFAVWTLLSFLWAPLAGTAYHDGQRVILYLGTLVAASVLLRGRSLAALQPAVAAGALVIVGYGLSERLLPWLLAFHVSTGAEGRLEQPLTYWNAMGTVAAIGVVLCAHLAGDQRRSDRVRIAAAVAAAPLGLGLYCSFSRGALFACVAGLVTLVVVAPTRSRCRGMALAVATGVAASLCAAPFSSVTSLAGSSSTRVIQGTAMLILLIAVALVAGLVQRNLCRREHARRLRMGALPLPRHAGRLALLVVFASFGLFLLVGSKETNLSPVSSGATRLTSLQSSRYAYWEVAWHAFRSEPLIGVGGGGWAVYWLRYRPFEQGAQDAHSFYIQTAAELGLVGLALLGVLIWGVVLAARRALRVAPNLAAGLVAGMVVWAAHAAVDWVWEMPAVTLEAMLLAGGLLALSELPRDELTLTRRRAPAVPAPRATDELQVLVRK